MEIWKDIRGWEGFYRISNLGQVQNATTKKMLTPAIGSNGYLHVDLRYFQKKTVSIHRLVAEAFVENPNKHPIVNHKDECKTNNTADNLEWCTTRYNVNYGKGALAKNSPVVQLDRNGMVIKTWESMKQASEAIGIKYQGISRVCRNERRTCGGFGWMYSAGANLPFN